MSLRKSVDPVVEENHVEVDVAAVGMDEVIATDGQSVTVTADLPNCQFAVGHLAAGSYGCRTSVNGVHAVGGHVMGQTAGATDT